MFHRKDFEVFTREILLQEFEKLIIDILLALLLKSKLSTRNQNIVSIQFIT